MIATEFCRQIDIFLKGAVKMYKFSGRRIPAFLMLVFFCAAILVSAACAETAADGDNAFTEFREQLLSAYSFKFQRHKDGIARGTCPVYTAPSENSLRLANRYLEVDTNQDIFEAGYSEEGWLLVRFVSSAGKTRVGYIPPKYLKKFKSSMSRRVFNSIPVVAADTISVMDNPVKPADTVAELAAGDSFVILAKYTYHGNWWYIECAAADGKITRGFIDRTTSGMYPGNHAAGSTDQAPVTFDTLGTPRKSPLGTEQTGEILVNGAAGEERKKVHQDADPEGRWVTVVYPARQYPCYGTRDAKGATWYYVFVEEDSTWGWVRSTFCTPVD